MVAEETAVGVPLIAPVDVSNVKPAGTDGEIDHDTTAPPVDVGVAVVIAESFVKVNGLPLYATFVGTASFTVMVTLAVSLPPVLLAVMVYEVEEVTAVGVPLIAPVEVSRDNPAGRDGDTEYETTVPPVDVTEVVVMAVPLVKVNELVL